MTDPGRTTLHVRTIAVLVGTLPLVALVSLAFAASFLLGTVTVPDAAAFELLPLLALGALAAVASVTGFAWFELARPRVGIVGFPRVRGERGRPPDRAPRPPCGRRPRRRRAAGRPDAAAADRERAVERLGTAERELETR